MIARTMLPAAIASALISFSGKSAIDSRSCAESAVVDAPSGTAPSTVNGAVITHATADRSDSSVASPGTPGELLMTGLTNHSVSLSWSAPPPSRYPIAHYIVYRNGSPYATVTRTRYTDHRATNAAAPAFTHAANVYAYAVSAVDTRGKKGPRAYPSVYLYHRGVPTQGALDYSYGITENWRDTRGIPPSGRDDLSLRYPAAGGGFQPYIALPLAPPNDLEIGGFQYFTFDVKVTDATHDFFIALVSRLPPGDVFPRAWVYLSSYCTPVVGQWVTCKVPLSALSMGFTNFTASVSGNQLTVTSRQSGVGVDAGGFVTGPGIPAGTYIVGTPGGITFNMGQPPGNGLGTYTVAGPGISDTTSVPSEPMVEQRTSLYKFDFAMHTVKSGTTIYLNNIGWTTN